MARQIPHRHTPFLRRYIPLPILNRLSRALRRTTQRGLPGLLLGLLVCAPIVRAQIGASDRQAIAISGTVLRERGNLPMSGVIVSVRSLAGETVTSALTDESGYFQVRGLNLGEYEIILEEAGYEPTQKTLEVSGPLSALQLFLKESNPSPRPPKDFSISVRELRIPWKARNAFQKGLERLTKDDVANSRTEFVRATTAFPDYYEAYYHMGVANLRLGRIEEAAAAFQKAIDLSGGHYAWAQFALGLLLCRQGEYREAAVIIRKGLDLDGSSPSGHLFLSVALFRLNRLGEAEKAAREALLRKPRFAWPYLVLADVHALQGQHAMQLHDLDAFLKIEPNAAASKSVREVRDAVSRVWFQNKRSATNLPFEGHFPEQRLSLIEAKP
ncbi:MAG TPA: tetratricopeptide repeat protein [Candidatus Dormibacteraeota bacterium]|nr:tetratricopeptide repeat protein [Candidatus Dormibacteraeota bacterium]